MATGKEVARVEPAALAQQGTAAASPRQAIQEALHAYELALAVRLKAQQDANADRDQQERLGTLADQDARRERERDQQAGQEIAATEAARIRALFQQASETEAAAIRLLETSALAHVRGVGDDSPPEPRTATDEQAAATFTAAQKAAADLRAALLKLAARHLGNQDWDSARSILIPFTATVTGPLRERATALLCRSYLNQAEAASATSDWHGTLAVIEQALDNNPDALRNDAALADLFLLATRRLMEAALSADRQATAAQYLASARARLGAGHPSLRELPRNQRLDWASGAAACLQEFGGHSQPVTDMAFTTDGEYLVSADGVQIKTWRLPRDNPGSLVSTVTAPGARWLADNGRLAVTTGGAILSTTDGTVTGLLAGISDGSVASAAGSLDGSTIAYANCGGLSREVNLSGLQGFEPIGLQNLHYGPAEYDAGAQSADKKLLAPLRDNPDLGRPAIMIFRKKEARVYEHGHYREITYRPGRVRLVESVLIADSRTGETRASFGVEPETIVLDVAVSSSADFVAWLNPYGQVTITDILTGVVRHEFSLETHGANGNAIAVSPQGRLVVIAQSNTVAAWDIATGARTCLWTIRDVRGACVSPDERLIAAMASGGVIRLYDLQAKSQLDQIELNPGVGEPGTPRIMFSPDGSRLAASGDRTITIWGIS